MNKILIIDGHNYLYRSYYGVPSSAKLPNGIQVNAYYGFLSLLRKIYLHTEPISIIVVFDSQTGIEDKIKENRNYKQNRKYLDTGMFKQLPIIKQALEYMGISYLENPQYEADDVIGSIAKKEIRNGKVYISSQDKDFFQLIDKNINILRSEKGDIIKYDIKYFKEKYGFSSNRYLEYISIKGDSSDNIKGIKGVGEKTAFKIINDSEDVLKSNLFDSKDRELIRKNIEFLKIDCNLSLDYSFKRVCGEKVMMSSNEILKILNQE